VPGTWTDRCSPTCADIESIWNATSTLLASWWRCWVKQCSPIGKVLGSTPLESLLLRATQSLTEMATNVISWSVMRPALNSNKLTNFVRRSSSNSGRLNLLKTQRNLQSCNCKLYLFLFRFACTVLKINFGRYKHKIKNSKDCVIWSSLKNLFDLPLFTLCIVVCIQKGGIVIWGTQGPGSANRLIYRYTR